MHPAGVADYRQLLKERLRDEKRKVAESWSKMRLKLEEDVRFNRCPARERERLFRRFVETL
jgi:hypothetical protein